MQSLHRTKHNIRISTSIQLLYNAATARFTIVPQFNQYKPKKMHTYFELGANLYEVNICKFHHCPSLQFRAI